MGHARGDVTPLEALREAGYECASRFRYVRDSDAADPLERLLRDEWDTRAEFEARGGGDCDGFAGWAIERAGELCPGAELYFVAGEVAYDSGKRSGHAWVELRDGGRVYWSDPTWGRLPYLLEDARYRAGERRPLRRWRYAGAGQFQAQEEYS